MEQTEAELRCLCLGPVEVNGGRGSPAGATPTSDRPGQPVPRSRDAAGATPEPGPNGNEPSNLSARPEAASRTPDEITWSVHEPNRGSIGLNADGRPRLHTPPVGPDQPRLGPGSRLWASRRASSSRSTGVAAPARGSTDVPAGSPQGESLIRFEFGPRLAEDRGGVLEVNSGEAGCSTIEGKQSPKLASETAVGPKSRRRAGWRHWIMASAVETR